MGVCVGGGGGGYISLFKEANALKSPLELSRGLGKNYDKSSIKYTGDIRPVTVPQNMLTLTS